MERRLGTMEKKAEGKAIGLDKFVLRCYGREIDKNKWYGVCINLNLAVEASSPDELLMKMKEVITSYLETVLDTKDDKSIPELLSRRAPIYDWIVYFYIACYHITHIPKDKFFKFKEFIPFRLAYDNC